MYRQCQRREREPRRQDRGRTIVPSQSLCERKVDVSMSASQRERVQQEASPERRCKRMRRRREFSRLRERMEAAEPDAAERRKRHSQGLASLEGRVRQVVGHRGWSLVE